MKLFFSISLAAVYNLRLGRRGDDYELAMVTRSLAPVISYPGKFDLAKRKAGGGGRGRIMAAERRERRGSFFAARFFKSSMRND